MRLTDGEVTTQDSVAIARAPTGRELCDGYLHEIQDLSLGLVRGHSNALYLGPLELLRFGAATVSDSAVEWPIEGGITAREPGGTFRIEATGGRLVASVDGYRPRLPMPLYAVSQLPVHHLLTRLYLLRVRGREPAPGASAAPQDRIRAAAIDVAFCLTLAGLAGKRRRLPVVLGIAAAYHVACWSISGRTLGGLVVRQRVVAVDGSRPTAMQAMVRFLALPLAWLTRRPVHDELAGTDVIVS
ncbi:MAG TPA: RDD family protein [Candidatus Dormibacteraeota bacterium]